MQKKIHHKKLVDFHAIFVLIIFWSTWTNFEKKKLKKKRVWKLSFSVLSGYIKLTLKSIVQHKIQWKFIKPWKHVWTKKQSNSLNFTIRVQRVFSAFCKKNNTSITEIFVKWERLIYKEKHVSKAPCTPLITFFTVGKRSSYVLHMFDSFILRLFQVLEDQKIMFWI